MVLLFLSSCNKINIVDHELCADIGSLGASCVHSLTDEKRDIPKADWDEYRFGQICADVSVITDYKAIIEKLCSKHNDCTFEEKTAITRLESFIENLRKK